MNINKLIEKLPLASTQEVNERIKHLSSESKPTKDFLYACWKQFENSPERDWMLIGKRYYENENDIFNRKRTFIGRQGEECIAYNMSNVKLSHPLYKKMVNQKVNYSSDTFSFTSEDPEFLKLLNTYFDKSLRKKLNHLARIAISRGLACLHPYYNVQGELRWKTIYPEDICPFWEDDDHSELQAAMLSTIIQQYEKDGTIDHIRKVSFWTREGVWYYVEDKDGNELVEDPDFPEENAPYGHVIAINADKNESGDLIDVHLNFDSGVPFLFLRYNQEEIPLIKDVKPLIDDYDITTSDWSNLLRDIPNAIKVIKGYGIVDPGEFNRNLSLFRMMIFEDPDADIEVLETPIDVEGYKGHLTSLRKDIYEAGQAVDTQEANIGNASGQALQFRYADLDIDAHNFNEQMSEFIDQMVVYVKNDILLKTGVDYTDTKFEVVFKTNILIRESDKIEDVVNSMGVLSRESCVENHPWTKNKDIEMERIDRELQEAIEQANFMEVIQTNGE